MSLKCILPKGYIPKDLSSNVKVLPWIPQNDLLAHKSTRAFVSHTGHNSLYEAAFYGVPLVCVPIFFDQFSNCAQAQSVGMAIGIDIKTATWPWNIQFYRTSSRTTKVTLLLESTNLTLNNKFLRHCHLMVRTLIKVFVCFPFSFVASRATLLASRDCCVTIRELLSSKPLIGLNMSTDTKEPSTSDRKCIISTGTNTTS